MVDRLVEQNEPRCPELGLMGELGSRPLRRCPDACDDDRKHHENLADEKLGRGHAGLPPACRHQCPRAWPQALKAPNSVAVTRSEEPTSELQSLMRISYAVFCLKKNKTANKKVNQ